MADSEPLLEGMNTTESTSQNTNATLEAEHLGRTSASTTQITEAKLAPPLLGTARATCSCDYYSYCPFSKEVLLGLWESHIPRDVFFTILPCHVMPGELDLHHCKKCKHAVGLHKPSRLKGIWTPIVTKECHCLSSGHYRCPFTMHESNHALTAVFRTQWFELLFFWAACPTYPNQPQPHCNFCGEIPDLHTNPQPSLLEAFASLFVGDQPEDAVTKKRCRCPFCGKVCRADSAIKCKNKTCGAKREAFWHSETQREAFIWSREELHRPLLPPVAAAPESINLPPPPPPPLVDSETLLKGMTFPARGPQELPPRHGVEERGPTAGTGPCYGVRKRSGGV